MTQKHGVKETKEALVAMLSLSALLTEKLKDGAQMSDAIEVWAMIQGDEQFKTELVKAWENIKMVPEEMKDLDLSEAVELLMAAIPGIQKTLMALSKK
jgi:SpoVK/Ycf46/Vps4 family AAA+-type ATPase